MTRYHQVTIDPQLRCRNLPFQSVEQIVERCSPLPHFQLFPCCLSFGRQFAQMTHEFCGAPHILI
jgi:hypothetical protein